MTDPLFTAERDVWDLETEMAEWTEHWLHNRVEEVRADEWRCDGGYCTTRELELLREHGYTPISYDTGPYRLPNGRTTTRLVLSPRTHVPRCDDGPCLPATLRTFADGQPRRYISPQDGHEYEYRYSAPDTRFYCRDLTIGSEEYECTQQVYAQLTLPAPQWWNPLDDRTDYFQPDDYLLGDTDEASRSSRFHHSLADDAAMIVEDEANNPLNYPTAPIHRGLYDDPSQQCLLPDPEYNPADCQLRRRTVV